VTCLRGNDAVLKFVNELDCVFKLANQPDIKF
jgi:hypothetical protein